MNGRLIFIVQSWGDPHEMNRLKHYTAVFNNIDIYAFTRNNVIYDFGLQFNNLGNLKNRNYLSRVFIYLKAVFLLCKLNIKNNVFYIQGSDNLFLYNVACIITFRKPKFIYQISDIREILTTPNPINQLFSFIDALFTERALLLVVTSEAFVEEYYKNKLRHFKVNYKLIENKIHLYNQSLKNIYPLKKIETPSDVITIGYFGILRCERSIKILLGLARTNRKFVIIIRGILSPGLKNYAHEFDKVGNIYFPGEFISPIHLKEMYNEIDLAWICYPYGESGLGNMNWARTNRFYEAGYFNTPMITQEGTKDSFRAKEYNIGITIDLGDIETCVQELSKLNINEIEKLKNNFENINEKTFIITNDYDDVDNFLKKVMD
ncbi:MAG: hypothetical protein ABI419_05545 [Ginsengibacter sp.]